MKLTKTAALVIAALVVGLVAGNVVGATAAPSKDAARGETTPLGLRFGPAMRDAGGRLADVVAKLTGQTADEVLSQRMSGKSLADIAAEKDVSTATVIGEALKVRELMLAERVKAGAITEAQAQAALERMETRLSERVVANGASCDGAGGRGARQGRGGGRRAGAGACDGTCGQPPADN